jgi:hypothetical protein
VSVADSSTYLRPIMASRILDQIGQLNEAVDEAAANSTRVLAITVRTRAGAMSRSFRVIVLPVQGDSRLFSPSSICAISAAIVLSPYPRHNSELHDAQMERKHWE